MRTANVSTLPSHGVDGMIQDSHPYRTPPIAEGGARAARIGYFPALGIFPIVALLAVAIPIAWGVRREDKAASTLTCSTIPETDYAPACLAHDARIVGPMERIPCGDLPGALDVLLDAKNPFARPFISAAVTEYPGAPIIVPSKTVTIAGRPTLTYEAQAPQRKKIARPAADENGGVQPDDARALVRACVKDAGVGEPHRTITLAVFERDFTASAIALGIGVVLALAFGFRRRVRVDVHPAGGIDLVERGFVLARRRLTLVPADVARVVVASGAFGPLVGTRVEIALNDGSTVPLCTSYMPLNHGRHVRAAARLALALGVS